MTMSKACKICMVLTAIVLLAGGGILAWQLLANDDKGENSSSFWPFGEKDNEQNVTTAPSVAPTTLAPSTAPSALPSVYTYPFDAFCPDDAFCCNGLETLCDWPVNEILFGGVHNAFATQDKFLVPNQLRPVNEALEAGFRAVGIDICFCAGTWQLCHGLCGLGQNDPYTILEELTSFLQENKREVVIVVMELNSEAGQAVNLTKFYEEVWEQTDGLTELLYFHQNPEDLWPTLGEMIDKDQRLIAFHLNGPECTAEGGDCPDGLHWYFRHAQETGFEFSSIDSLLDTESSCAVTRGATTTTGAFLGVNSFVTASALQGLDEQLLDAETANSLDFANQRLQDCSQVVQEGVYQGDGKVNMLYVDFWDQGDIVQLVQEYNRDLGEYEP